MAFKRNLRLKNAKHVTFNQITAEAVSEVVKHPRKIDDELKQAKEAHEAIHPSNSAKKSAGNTIEQKSLRINLDSRYYFSND